MKLNNRGWGLQAMLVGVLVLMIALVIIAVLIQKTFNDIMEPINNENHYSENESKAETKYDSYEEIENAIISAAKKYQKEYYSNILDGEKISVTLKNLQEEKLIGEINDIKNKENICSGYATFINENDKILYNAYIKCGDNYETVGYQDFYDMY